MGSLVLNMCKVLCINPDGTIVKKDGEELLKTKLFTVDIQTDNDLIIKKK